MDFWYETKKLQIVILGGYIEKIYLSKQMKSPHTSLVCTTI